MEQDNTQQQNNVPQTPAQPAAAALQGARQQRGFGGQRQGGFNRGPGGQGGPGRGGFGGGRGGFNRGPGGQGGFGGKPGFRRGFGGPRGDKPEKLYDSKTIEISRVTRVTGGGKKMSFRSIVVIGDKNGKVGLGVAKGKDVAMANEKAGRYAKRAMIIVPIVNGTIPHEVRSRAGASEIILKPQAQGRGIVAGGAARVIFSMAGYKNVTAKYLGNTKNKLNNARAAFLALSKLKMNKKKGEAKDQLAVAKPSDQIQE